MKTLPEILTELEQGKISADHAESLIQQSSASQPMSAEPTVQQLREASKNNPDTFLAGALYVIDNYKLNSPLMSAEQYSSGAIHSIGEFPAPAMSAKQGLCRWIKASERLPGIGKVVLVKYFDIYQELYYKNKVWFVKGTNLVAYSECFSLQLEWLETLSTAPTVKADGRKPYNEDGTCKKCGGNQCDSDSHK